MGRVYLLKDKCGEWGYWEETGEWRILYQTEVMAEALTRNMDKAMIVRCGEGGHWEETGEECVLCREEHYMASDDTVWIVNRKEAIWPQKKLRYWMEIAELSKRRAKCDEMKTFYMVIYKDASPSVKKELQPAGRRWDTLGAAKVVAEEMAKNTGKEMVVLKAVEECAKADVPMVWKKC